MVKLEYSKDFSLYSKHVLPVRAQVSKSKTLVVNVRDRGAFRKIRPYLSRYHKVLIPAIVFAWAEKEKQVPMVAQLETYMFRFR
jgi:hypothetical protein